MMLSREYQSDGSQHHHRRRHSGTAQRRRLRAGRSVICNAQNPAAGAHCTRRERNLDDARRGRNQRSAARVGFRKVARIRSSKGNNRKRDGIGDIVGHCHRLRSGRRAHPNAPKTYRRRRQRHGLEKYLERGTAATGCHAQLAAGGKVSQHESLGSSDGSLALHGLKGPVPIPWNKLQCGTRGADDVQLSVVI